MKYLKTYEFFGLPKKEKEKKELDKVLLMDLLDSDLDGLNYMEHDIISSIDFVECPIYYKSDSNGLPILKKEKEWYGKSIEYAVEPPGNYQAFIDRGIDNILTRINSGRFNKGVGMFVNLNLNRNLDSREEFLLTYFVYSNINKKRMDDYGIGYCLYKTFPEYQILFYLK